VPRRLSARRRPLQLAALAATAAALALAGLIGAGPADSAKPTVTLSGRAYVFNHSEQGIAGATIRVRERAGLSAVTDAVGDYALEVPDDADITPYIEPPPGYHQIDLQTFHTRGRDLENVNFQTPADAEYNGLAALLSVPFGPDGRPEQCAIVTTASARNVRGVDFETFRERTPHGVPGATARAKPALPGAAIYFNDSVIPDPSRAETSGDGGIIWTEVPAGTYRVITKSPSTRFASFLATCEPGRIVNANPPWGAYELTSGERPLGAGVVAGRVVRVGRGHRAGRRLVIVSLQLAERLRGKLALHQGRRTVGRMTRTFGPPSDKIPLRVSPDAEAGRAKLTVKLIDAAGDKVTEKFRVRLPAA
jgi:hypothetical protein